MIRLDLRGWRRTELQPDLVVLVVPETTDVEQAGETLETLGQEWAKVPKRLQADMLRLILEAQRIRRVEKDILLQKSRETMTINFNTAEWINPPSSFEFSENSVKLTTDPNTDFWQRSYYGFRNDNAPALLVESDKNFTFMVKVSFEYQERYDQCGVIIYIDGENWFKASIEYETVEFSRLGSVVTNYGYSDWATTDIATINEIWYRLSRRDPDFLIESSLDGEEFRQMRIFHLHKLGETTAEMAKLDPPARPEQSIKFGIYACSPLDSSFTAVFEEFGLEGCRWLAHE